METRGRDTEPPVPLATQADWDIVKKGWDAHVLGEAPNKFTDPVEAVSTLRVSCPLLCPPLGDVLSSAVVSAGKSLASLLSCSAE